jgi:hypothetical protein
MPPYYRHRDDDSINTMSSTASSSFSQRRVTPYCTYAVSIIQMAVFSALCWTCGIAPFMYNPTIGP